MVVVESRGKINKIQSILGNKYVVIASDGHIFNLDKKKSVDVNNDFQPYYISDDRQKRAITNIKNTYAKSSDVLLAADEDREGEMIAWSIANVLKLKSPKRIVFNSITKSEILNAVKNVKTIDQNMVDAQKARRIIDRLVGWEISPLLFKNFKYGKLSAGRVQSVVTRLIIDKEDEIKKFITEPHDVIFKTKGNFITKDNDNLDAQLYDIKTTIDGMYKGNVSEINTKNDVIELLEKCKKSQFIVENIYKKESMRNPPPPFTTSTLQQEASKKLHFTGTKTMKIAQTLYEAGLITYMRTDSVNICDEALNNIEKYIVQNYGNKFYKLNKYEHKKKNTQEAHEAIRPTDVFVTDIKSKSDKISIDDIKLYTLIWKRTVASQMESAIYDNTVIQISISDELKRYFETTIENLVFEGYLKVYEVDAKNEEIINIKKGDPVACKYIVSNERFENPPSRYNESSLIGKMDPKNLGIGRPSTYSTIINKIVEKKYVDVVDLPGDVKKSTKLTLSFDNNDIDEIMEDMIIGAENKKFVPTEIGLKINDFLVKHFDNIMDYHFTSKMEKELDHIALGKKQWLSVLNNFYTEFHPRVSKLIEKPIDNIKKIIGKHPVHNVDIIAFEEGVYGPYIIINISKSKNLSAPIKPPLTYNTITLDDAIKLLEYPKNIGKYKNGNILLKKGEHSFYIEYVKNKISISDSEAENITLELAIDKIVKSIDYKKNGLANFSSDTFKYTILQNSITKGKYINVQSLTDVNKKYTVTLPEDIDIANLTLEKVKEIVDSKWTNNKPKFIKFKKYKKIKD